MTLIAALVACLISLPAAGLFSAGEALRLSTRSLRGGIRRKALRRALAAMAAEIRWSRDRARILSKKNREIERLGAAKSRFLSIAAHDLRTPLGTLQGFGELLRARLRGREEGRYAGHIVRGAGQIGRLASDLTDLAAIEAGKLRMDKRIFDLSSLISDVVPAAAEAAGKKGIRLRVPAARPGIAVFGDRVRLAQALANLLGNAVKFTPPGGRVELRAAAGPRTLSFEVRDTGPGVHPSERGLIFERFYQSRFLDRKSKARGWGAGLSIAQEIVRSHQGEIGVDSAGPATGSAFWLRIPIRPLLAAALFLAASCSQAQTPDRSLEDRAERVLSGLLGPGRSRCAVDSEFSVDHSSSQPPRLRVTLVVDGKVPSGKVGEITRILPELLRLKPERGDSLSVLQASFEPSGPPFPYGLSALAILISAGLCACFLHLSRALARLAEAQKAQADLESSLPAPVPEPAAPALEGEREPASNPYFSVSLAKADSLAELLKGQDPENLALVLSRLAPEVREAFLDRLDPAAARAALGSLASVRFVDPGMIEAVGFELERRLGSAVGGTAGLAALVRESSPEGREKMLKMLEEGAPEAARALREGPWPGK